MNDHQIKWFKRSLADEGLLHSMLLYAAKHNEILTGASREVEIYCHRGEVMRIVTERLGSGRDKLIDTTIDIVACLVLFEVNHKPLRTLLYRHLTFSGNVWYS